MRFASYYIYSKQDKQATGLEVIHSTEQDYMLTATKQLTVKLPSKCNSILIPEIRTKGALENNSKLRRTESISKTDSTVNNVNSRRQTLSLFSVLDSILLKSTALAPGTHLPGSRWPPQPLLLSIHYPVSSLKACKKPFMQQMCVPFLFNIFFYFLKIH